ncbi:MAG: DUF2442 domain-containing protein [Deltaproteobacteria bacterium]|jgi:DUF971 family protein|nr:DUF2442 domain-containing protein [Deltaproteobacteria bacterium]
MIRIIEVRPNENYTLSLKFSDGRSGIFDVKPYLNKGIFKELKNIKTFKSVKISDATIEWINGADLCPECVYEDTEFL